LPSYEFAYRVGTERDQALKDRLEIEKDFPTVPLRLLKGKIKDNKNKEKPNKKDPDIDPRTIGLGIPETIALPFKLGDNRLAVEFSYLIAGIGITAFVFGLLGLFGITQLPLYPVIEATISGFGLILASLGFASAKIYGRSYHQIRFMKILFTRYEARRFTSRLNTLDKDKSETIILNRILQLGAGSNVTVSVDAALGHWENVPEATVNGQDLSVAPWLAWIFSLNNERAFDKFYDRLSDADKNYFKKTKVIWKKELKKSEATFARIDATAISSLPNKKFFSLLRQSGKPRSHRSTALRHRESRYHSWLGFPERSPLGGSWSQGGRCDHFGTQ